MSDCNHDCSHCDSKCENEIKFDQPHKDSHIKKVIGVVSRFRRRRHGAERS